MIRHEILTAFAHAGAHEQWRATHHQPRRLPQAWPSRREKTWPDMGPAYPSGEGRLFAEDVIVNIEGAAGTMIVSV